MYYLRTKPAANALQFTVEKNQSQKKTQDEAVQASEEEIKEQKDEYFTL